MRFGIFAFFMILAVGILAGATSGAGAQSYSGHSSGAPVQNNFPTPMPPGTPQPPQQQIQQAPATAPPAFQGTDIQAPYAPQAPIVSVPATTAPAAPAAVTGTAPAVPEAKPDPCAAYLANYDYYTICQDRMQKIQRMQDARTKRQTPEVKPVETPAVPAKAEQEPATTRDEYKTKQSGFIK